MAKTKEIEEVVIEPTAVEEPKVAEKDMNELVPIMLFKDNGKYKEPLFVSVNGESILIPRGERFEIKRKFWEVIEQSQTQDAQTAQLIGELAEEYKRNQRDLV